MPVKCSVSSKAKNLRYRKFLVFLLIPILSAPSPKLILPFDCKFSRILKKLLNFFALQGQAIDSEHLSEYTEEELEVNFNQSRISGFAKWDIKYLTPFFTRRFTQQVIVASSFPAHSTKCLPSLSVFAVSINEIMKGSCRLIYG